MTIQPLELRPVEGSWCRGFRPVYQKELSYWFGTYRWITQLILWLSLTAVPAIWLTPHTATDQGISYLTLFLWLVGSIGSIGTILLAQSSVIEEKLTQTLLWICSKPLSSIGFILAKFCAYAVLIGIVVLGLPALLIFVAAMIVGLPSQVSLLNYAGAVCVIYLMLLLFLALTLMLGTLLERVGAVSAIALFIFFGGASLNSDRTLRQIEPYSVNALSRYATKMVIGQISTEAWIAISITLALIAFCLLIANWRMQQYEF